PAARGLDAPALGELPEQLALGRGLGRPVAQGLTEQHWHTQRAAAEVERRLRTPADLEPLAIVGAADRGSPAVEGCDVLLLLEDVPVLRKEGRAGMIGDVVDRCASDGR